jgi:hypothetical protein
MTGQGGGVGGGGEDRGGVGGGIPPADDPGRSDPGVAADPRGTERDTGVVTNVVTLAEEAVFERLLAGGIPGADDPGWAAHLARLVRVADAPGRPDELADEDEIVALMVEARREAVAELPGGAADTTVVRLPARRMDEPWPARHDRERGAAYRAKHMAARLEASSHPAVRNLGRVLAVKAAAVTTAVVVGTVAAAAATTGIVATVVVPALTGTKAPPADPGTDADDDGDGDGFIGGTGSSDDRTTDGATSFEPSICAESPADCSTEAPTTSEPVVAPSTTVTTEASTDDEPVATSTTESPLPEDPPPTTAPATTVPEPTTTTTTTTTTVPDPQTTMFAENGTQSGAATLATSSTPSAPTASAPTPSATTTDPFGATS